MIKRFFFFFYEYSHWIELTFADIILKSIILAQNYVTDSIIVNIKQHYYDNQLK